MVREKNPTKRDGSAASAGMVPASRRASLEVQEGWEAAHPGARASRPHTSWHSHGQLLNPGRPATAPGRCFGRAYAVSAGKVAGRRIAGK
ncbi:MAG: hypothetical protein OXH11_03220, partial [Candidatus Aminicenantes bacterium]|nr:hypothetical protein [Candidatus Aminicenantes bacterium]